MVKQSVLSSYDIRLTGMNLSTSYKFRVTRVVRDSRRLRFAFGTKNSRTLRHVWIVCAVLTNKVFKIAV